MKKCLLFALAALMLLLLTACTGGDLPGEETHSCPVTVCPETDPPTEPVTAPVTEAPTEPETEAPPKELTMEKKETIPVITDGRTEYTIVAPTDEAVAAEVAYMTRVMQARFGAAPAVAASATGKAIRVEYTDGDSGLDWRVIVDEDSGNILIQSGGTEGLCRAIRHFVTQCLSGPAGDLLVDIAADYRYTYATDQIDNSSLLSYKGGDKTELAPSDAEGTLMTPTWLDTAVMVELRIDTASIGGKLSDSYDLVDFYAATGVNVLWLSPVYERGAGGNGYGNVGLHRIEPGLTGTSDQEVGWNELKRFVDYAHSKGVYILLDVISWGSMAASPLLTEHPDWFSGEAWGNPAFNWKNPEMKEWFISTAVANIEKTGADGYRCDCEPFTAGYEVWAEVRRRLNDKGIYPVIMSEEGGRRDQSFDCEQDGVLKYQAMTRGQLYQNPVNFFVDGYLNIVTSSQKGVGLGGQELQSKRQLMGTYRYYTNCITNHDYQERNVNGNRLKIGYAAIYAPYIPLWYMGDEFGVTMDHRAVLYDVGVDYSAVGSDPARTYFYEDVKEMIAIRRTYPEIFEEWPLSHRDTNICKVEVEGLSELTNYARYAGDKAILVVANNEEGNDGICRVKIPFADLFGETAPDQNYRVTDLSTGRVIAVGFADTVDNFDAIVPYEHCGVYLVEKIS